MSTDRAHRSRVVAVLVLAIALAGVVLTSASGADFEADHGPCPEPPGGGPVLQCPTGRVGVPYQVQLESEEGSGCNPYVWYEIVNSSLPAGLTISRSGVISGVPTSAGVARFWVWNHDLTAAQGGPSWCAFDDRSEREFSIAIDPGLEIANASLKPGTLGEPYADALTAERVMTINPRTASDVQATWSVQSGALPAGITLSSQGALSGTPTTEGAYQFVVKAEEAGTVVTKTYTLSIRSRIVIAATFATRSGRAEVGIPYQASFAATGGSGTFTWAPTSGSLPEGITFAPTGSISGRPMVPGRFPFTVTATDGEGRTADFSFTLAVAPKLEVKSTRLTAATLGRRYRARIATVGGVQPVRWKIVRGRLPLGIRLATRQGILMGTPRRAGIFRVTVQASDVLRARSQRTLVLVVKR